MKQTVLHKCIINSFLFPRITIHIPSSHLASEFLPFRNWRRILSFLRLRRSPDSRHFSRHLISPWIVRKALVTESKSAPIWNVYICFAHRRFLSTFWHTFFLKLNIGIKTGTKNHRTHQYWKIYDQKNIFHNFSRKIQSLSFLLLNKLSSCVTYFLKLISNNIATSMSGKSPKQVWILARR